MTNGLVYVGKIVSIEEIPDADRIDLATVICGVGGKWHGVVNKGAFVVGDLAIVYLQDSVLPPSDDYKFMERTKWRVRMAKMRGVPSECLIMPLTFPAQVGEDVTQAMGVTKYFKEIPASVSGDVYGEFPAFVPKTDEPNFQKVEHLVDALVGQPYYASLKCDGSSATVFNWQNRIGACSRNWEMKHNKDNAIWRIVDRYNVEDKLPYGYAIQFEVVGPGIQGNKMKLDRIEPRLFNVYDIREQKYLGMNDVLDIQKRLEFPKLKIVEMNQSFSKENLQQRAESAMYGDKPGEGLVFRPIIESNVNRERLSFKVINLNYKEA